MKTGAASAVFALLRSAKSEKASFYEARLSAYEAFYGIAAKYEAPQMRYEAKPDGFIPPFFWGKKMAADFFISTRHSELHFELENSEFGCEMNF